MGDHKHILIAGASISGPALAWFLSRSGHKVTIVERSPSFRTGGQQVDLSGPGLDVVRYMGLYHTIKAASVQQAGFRFVNSANKTIATLAADKEGQSEKRPGLVREIEVLRGDLARVLFDEIQTAGVEYVFNDCIKALADRDDCITVGFANSRDRSFDLVVGADGLGSQTRAIAFGDSSSCIKSLGQCMAYFTIPWQESDGTFDRWYNAPGGRIIYLRPQPSHRKTGAYFGLMTDMSRGLAKAPVEQQKDEYARVFADAGWEAPRVLEAMQDCTDFYAQETAQVKLERWSTGRTVLLGDAAYCPSPVSGQGTTLAFLGAYILAGCIASHPDHQEALRQYETHMRPFVNKSQKLLPGAPAIACPQSKWSIWVLHTVVWLVSLLWSGWFGVLGEWILSPVFSVLGAKEVELPEFPALDAMMRDRTGVEKA